MNEWVDTECLRSKQRAEDAVAQGLVAWAWVYGAMALWFLGALGWEIGSGYPSGGGGVSVALACAVADLSMMVGCLRKLGVPWW